MPVLFMSAVRKPAHLRWTTRRSCITPPCSACVCVRVRAYVRVSVCLSVCFPACPSNSQSFFPFLFFLSFFLFSFFLSFFSFFLSFFHSFLSFFLSSSSQFFFLFFFFFFFFFFCVSRQDWERVMWCVYGSCDWIGRGAKVRGNVRGILFSFKEILCNDNGSH